MARDHKVEPISADSDTDVATTDEAVLNKFALKVYEQEKKIRKLWKAGQSPRVIRIQFPTYTEHDIVTICQAAYDISKIDFKNLDGILFQGFIEDIQELDNLYDKSNTLENKLSVMNLKLSARERTMKYRELLMRIYQTKSSQHDEEEEDTPSGTMELRMKAKLSQITDPKKRKEFIEMMEKLQEQTVNNVLDGDFSELEDQT